MPCWSEREKRVIYKVRRATEVTRDFDIIEDYLVQAYQGFGEDVEDAVAKAIARVEEAQAYIRTFTTHPYRGTEHPHIRSGLRTVTSNRFVYYFDIDEPQSQITVLAVFFGDMDHRRQILDRLQEPQR